MVCEKCNKQHNGKFGSGRFCSRECANSREITNEIKNKISLSLRTPLTKYCKICGKKLKRSNITNFCLKCKPKALSKPKREIIQTFRDRRKEKAVKLFGGKCSICGYNKCRQALEFHHENSENKIERWRTIKLNGSEEKFLKEIDRKSVV
jgi:hypothetical protein